MMKSRRILIVDDEALARLDIGERIGRIRKDCQVIGQAGNGKIALEMIEKLAPDIVLIDIKMPVMDGIEVIRIARERKLNCRFIVLSCFEEYSLVREALHLGSDDYLLKHTCTDEDLDAAITHTCEELDRIANRRLGWKKLRELMWQQMLEDELSEEELLTCIKAGLFDMESKQYLLLLLGGQAKKRWLEQGCLMLNTSNDKEKWIVLEDDGQRLQGLVKEIQASLEENETCSIYLHASGTILDFLREYRQTKKNGMRYMSRKTKQAIEYMHKHYAEQISVESTAEAIGISKTYFSQTFKKETGYSFSEWMQKYRMQKACELLTNTNYKIYEISEMVGFTDQAYFSVTFKRLFGVSPYQFREGK